MCARVSVLTAAILVCASATRGETIQVSVTVDDPVILLGETTRIHISAEIFDGQAGKGLYAYALNVLFGSTGVIDIDAVQQPGDPNPAFSDDGMILSDGLHDVFGGDGGFFDDPERGLGAPFEFLTLIVSGTSVGTTSILPGAADSASALGVPEGFLLQSASELVVDFGSASLVVAPEPSSIMGSLALAPLFRRRGRFFWINHSL